MRWPVQIQFLLPMLLIVLLAIMLASGTTAYWAAARVRTQQQEDLQRVARVVGEARYPLSGSVLSQISGLSGADFVILDHDGHIREATLNVAASDARWFAEQEQASPQSAARRERVATLDDQKYLFQRVGLTGRYATPTAGSLYILFREDRWSAPIRRAAYPAILTGSIAAGVAMVTTVLLARRFVRPIHQLVRRTAAIAAGDFRPAIAVSRRNDELRDLEDSINRMAERLGQYENEIRRAEQLQTLGKIGAGVAHQLRNAAAGGRIAVELHLRECPLGPADESLHVALRQFHLMESFLQRFLAVGKPTGGERTCGPAAALVTDVIELLHPMAQHLGVQLNGGELDESVTLRGDREAIRQLLSNLVLNACEAATEAKDAADAPQVNVHLARATHGFGVIRVCDTGPGPPAAIQERLFEPFVTGKPSGLGLGLFVARQIAQAHGGDLSWQRHNGATCFSFTFPTGDEHGQRPDRG